MAPAVGGVLETAIWVKDMERAAQFYQGLFGFEPLVRDARICALHVPGPQVLLLFLEGASTKPIALPGGVIPPFEGRAESHLAFSVTLDDLARWEAWLQEKGIAIESRVKWERGGQSIYFRDPDSNLVELVTRGTWAVF